MNNSLLIFIGAGLGGILRYWISNGIYTLFGKDFPYGTLAVNVTGSFLMGLLFILTIERFDTFASQLRSFMLIGLLGGYTTFSSFSIETMNLIEGGSWMSAFMNIFLSLVGCLIAVWLGIISGRSL